MFSPVAKRNNKRRIVKRAGRAASFVSLASPLETAQSPLRCEKLHRFREEGGFRIQEWNEGKDWHGE